MNRRGAVLIFAYMIIMALTVLGAIFISTSVSENTLVRRHIDSTRAFWIAEAGLAQVYYEWINGVAFPEGETSFGEGTYTVNASDLFNVTVSGTFNGVTRTVSSSFLQIPYPFQNTISTGGDLILSGWFGWLSVTGKTRISGRLKRTGYFTDLIFEDIEEGTDSTYTTIQIPDFNNNGTPDEFDDFVSMGRNAVQIYVPQTIDWDSLDYDTIYSYDQAIYLKTNGSVILFPHPLYKDKKVLYLESDSPADGTVHLFFDTTWQPNQDMTIISTGKINYSSPLMFWNSRLSLMSWGDYTKYSAAINAHWGSVYTHSAANFTNYFFVTGFAGNIIANEDINMREIAVIDTEEFSDRAIEGDLPPGFQFLCTTPNQGVSKLKDWQESE